MKPKREKAKGSLPQSWGAKKKGVNSNWYLGQLAEKGLANLTADEQRELSLLIRNSHRITPVATSKEKGGKTVFNSVTGHHEWLPTDCALKIMGSTGVWRGFYTVLRSPTWLLVVNPERYCADLVGYGNTLQVAARHVMNKSGQKVLASSLGLVGHSGGLCNAQDTQLTSFQSNWHDELRDIYTRHAEANSYDLYWKDLQDFIGRTFLFVAAPTIPTGNAQLGSASIVDVMKSISWDLKLSGRGNPPGAKVDTLYDVAGYLHEEWKGWYLTLFNSYKAYRA